MRHLIPLIALMVLAACGSNDKSTTVTSTDGEEIKITSDTDKDNESGTITFEGKDGAGKVVFGDAAVKQGLPLGLPVYPGGEVRGAFMGSSEKDGSAGGMASVVTADPPAKVIAFYRAEAEKRGMKVKTTATADDTSTFSAKGANGASLVVTTTPGEGGKTTASIIGGSKN